MTPEPSTDLILRLTLTSDWGVATGAGVAGGVDAVIERGGDGRPVVRGTVITGLMREQALNAAHALDGARPDGPWAALAATLFGTPTQPRLVAFSDAPVSVTPATAPDGRPRPATHEVVGVSIDAETGTAKDDFLRFLERAGSGVGESAVTLLTETLDRTPVTWSPRQYADARLLLALAAQLVTAVGSDRPNGDGACQALLCDDDAELGRQWCAEVVRRLRAPGAVRAPHLPTLATSEPARLAAPAGAARTGGGAPAPAGVPGAAAAGPARSGAPGAVGRPARPGPAMAAEPGPAMAAELTLTIVLTTPLVSYDVPYSNEVRSLDFLRGTVLLPWVHSRLRHAFVGSDLVRDAVVTGRLRVSDATPVVGGVRGLPVPLVLSRPKVPGARQETLEIWNRLLRGEPSEVHVPLRSGYVFYPDPGADAATGAPGGTAPGSATASGPTVCLGAPVLTGRQSTAMDTATGTVATGQLFMVRAIPAGVTLQAQVSLSADLYDAVGPRLDELLSVPARLGSRRFSGSYGQVVCQAGRADTGLRAGGHPEAGGRTEGGRATSRSGPGGAPGGTGGAGGAGDAAGDGVTVWCTSDLLLRSPRLGPVDGMTGLLRALGGGIELELVGSSGPVAPGPHLTPAPRGPGGARALRPGGSPGLPAVVGRAQDARYSAGLRYRRVDGWSAADQQPRASRVAVQAGSTLRVRPTDPGAMGSLRRHLARLERDGVGLLREQGYGRIAVGHPFLGPGPDVIRARVLQQSDFTTEGQGQ